MSDAPQTGLALAGKPESRQAVMPPRVDTQVGLWMVCLRMVAVWWTFFKVTTIVIADVIGLRRLFYWVSRRDYDRITKARRLRIAFEDLGPTYIKFGQMIASSEGLFPKALSEEFRKCLDEVPPFAFEQVEHIIRSEIGRPVDEVYSRINREPLAAASIAQVHAACLADGTEVVIKVQRPRLRRRVAADVRIMLMWARLLARISYRFRLANLVGIVEDFARTITEELEFRLEAWNMDDFNALFEGREDNRICAPRVHWDATTRRLITMERFVGWRVDDVEAMQRMDDTESHLVAGLLGWFESILSSGFFHGDVHAGNLMYLEDGRIGFLDFGIVGRFDEQQRIQAMSFMISLAMRDYSRFADLVMEMSPEKDAEDIDIEALAGDLEKAYGPLVDMSMSEMNYQEVLPEIMRTALRHGLKFPQEFILITKQFLYFDRYARLLAPNLNLFQDARIYSLLLSKLPEIGGGQATGMIMGAMARAAG